MTNEIILKIRKDSFKLIGGICLYRIILDIIYLYLIVPQYGYVGFVDQSSLSRCFFSWTVVLASLPCILGVLHNIQDRISNIIVAILYFASYIPFTSWIYAGKWDGRYVFCNIIFWSILTLGQNLLQKRNIYPVRIARGNIKWNNQALFFIGILSACIVFYISYRYTGFRLNFDLNSVYDLRSNARSFALPTLLQYLFSWTTVINSILLGYCILRKKYLLSSIIFLVQMLSFGINGMKTTFFMTIATVILCCFVRKNEISPLKFHHLPRGVIGCY